MSLGNSESAGKRKSGRTHKGNQKLRSALVEAARAAARTKNTYLSSLIITVLLQEESKLCCRSNSCVVFASR
ncbi:transposase [Desulforamulus putei]|uniref:transposase n=1 Tax=Desulforamulus putei TaxID=74701 RepID=UPI003A5BB631